MITDIVAAIAISAKNTPHAIFLLFEMLIFVKFYMCEKCGIQVQIMHMQVLLKVVTMDYIKQENQ